MRNDKVEKERKKKKPDVVRLINEADRRDKLRK